MTPSPDLAELTALDRYERIAIRYELDDIWNEYEDGEPEDGCAQIVHGEIAGSWWDEERDDSQFEHCGSLQLARIDFTQTPEARRGIFYVLDSHSSEWCQYLRLFEAADGPDWMDGLLLVERVWLAPPLRGRGVGLHVMARAIAAFAHPGDCVALLASPTELPGAAQDGRDAEAIDDLSRRAGERKLSSYWQQLGFRRLADSKTAAPLLWRHADELFQRALPQYAQRWQQPAQLGAAGR